MARALLAPVGALLPPTRTTLALAALAALAIACQSRTPEPNGIGPYVLAKTKLVDGEVNGRCLPVPEGDVVQCIGYPAVKLGEQAADVNLYFAGKDPSAPLVEIGLSIRGCKPDAAAAALDAALGTPTETAERRRVWARKAAYVVAKLPSDGVTCEIFFVDPKDEKRVAQLQAEAKGS